MPILVLPSDGISREMTAVIVAVVERASALWQRGRAVEEDVAGFDNLQRCGSTVRDELVERFTIHDKLLADPAMRIADLGVALGTRGIGDAVAGALG